MTEQEWLAGTDPRKMLEFLRGKASNRKVRLFEVACCRRIWRLLPDDDCRQAVLVAERFADGNATDRERRAVRKLVATIKESGDLASINARGAAFDANEKTAGKKFGFGSAAVAAAEGRGAVNRYRRRLRAEEKAQAALLRCIFGNPFRPICIAPAWQTPQAVALAQAAYEQRERPAGTLDATRLAVLADALEDAGCDQADLVAHLRGPGSHVRDCWAVDLILGKQ